MFKLIKSVVLTFALLLLLTSNVSALEFRNSIEHLTTSPDYQEVLGVSEELCGILNSLLDTDAQITVSDLGWSNTYKIYVDDSDIFALDSFSKQALTGSMVYIWSYAAVIDGRQVRATIARAQAPNPALLEQGLVTEEDYQRLLEKTGQWSVSEAVIDTQQSPAGITALLEDAGVGQDTELILVGGSPRMRSLFAVTFSDGHADQLIPLARTGSTLADFSTSSTTLTSNSIGTEGFQAGSTYDFQEAAAVLSSSAAPAAYIDTGNSYSQNPSFYYLTAMLSVLGLGTCLLYWKRTRS